MHIGYCEVYRYRFRAFLTIGAKVRIFVLKERKFHRKESSRERKFLERSLPRNERSTGARTECSTERKFHGNCYICGLFAPRNESAEERKVRHWQITPCLPEWETVPMLSSGTIFNDLE